jgi:hypothetical protein
MAAASKPQKEMPTILRKDGFRFFFFSREGTEPPHIHVEQAEAIREILVRTCRFVGRVKRVS